MDVTRQPHVLGDWGTTRLRLFLVRAGAIVDRRDGDGIALLQQAPLDTLQRLVEPWLESSSSIDITLAGMAGSRSGLFEVPYCLVPAKVLTWQNCARSENLRGLSITIAAGLCGEVSEGSFDVMRGEETQVFGAMSLDPALAVGSHVFVLPGTHSKWIETRDGAITRFRTAMTGEVYALLREHSTLLKAGGAGGAAADTEAGFAAGVDRCVKSDAGLLAALFEARTAQLLRNRSREWACGFLSGLLIAYEISTLGDSFGMARQIAIVGDATLTSLYHRVLAERGVAARSFDGCECALAGLQDLHRHVEVALK